MERRSEGRVSLYLRATGRAPARPQAVTILDLSPTGCRAVLSNFAVPGSTINIDLLPGLNIRGMVMWSSGMEVGVRFQRRLKTSEAIELGLQHGPPAPKRPAYVPQEAQSGLQHWVRKFFGLGISNRTSSPEARRASR